MTRLAGLDLLVSLLTSEADFVGLQFAAVSERFGNESVLTPSFVVGGILALRTDIPAPRRKELMAPILATAAEQEKSNNSSTSSLSSQFFEITVQSAEELPVGKDPFCEIELLVSKEIGTELKDEKRSSSLFGSSSSSSTAPAVPKKPTSGVTSPSEPVVVTLVELSRRKSRRINNSVAPQWSQSWSDFTARDCQAEHIWYTVWGHSLLGRNSFLGQARLTMEEVRRQQLLHRSLGMPITAPCTFRLKLEKKQQVPPRRDSDTGNSSGSSGTINGSGTSDKKTKPKDEPVITGYINVSIKLHPRDAVTPTVIDDADAKIVAESGWEGAPASAVTSGSSGSLLAPAPPVHQRQGSGGTTTATTATSSSSSSSGNVPPPMNRGSSESRLVAVMAAYDRRRAAAQERESAAEAQRIINSRAEAARSPNNPHDTVWVSAAKKSFAKKKRTGRDCIVS
jgi:hypothetical protein